MALGGIAFKTAFSDFRFQYRYATALGSAFHLLPFRRQPSPTEEQREASRWKVATISFVGREEVYPIYKMAWYIVVLAIAEG